MKKLLFLIFILFIFIPSEGISQKKEKDPFQVDSLKILARRALSQPEDSLKLLYNIRYTEKLKTILQNPASFEFAFDSVRTMGILTSPDKKFRLYNWNIPLSNGTSRYFCILQLPEKKSVRLVELSDHSDSIQDPERKILDAGSWYGALYYKIIVQKSGPKNIYTLLGWNGYSPDKSRKLIEILTFDPKGNPVFGAGIFRNFQKGRFTRIFFDYPSDASFMLKYDDQIVTLGKKWNPGKKRYEAEEKKMLLIVADHLVQVTSDRGEQVMAPSDLFDGFVFQNNAWNFISGIDARNP